MDESKEETASFQIINSLLWIQIDRKKNTFKMLDRITEHILYTKKSTNQRVILENKSIVQSYIRDSRVKTKNIVE